MERRTRGITYFLLVCAAVAVIIVAIVPAVVPSGKPATSTPTTSSTQASSDTKASAEIPKSSGSETGYTSAQVVSGPIGSYSQRAAADVPAAVASSETSAKSAADAPAVVVADKPVSSTAAEDISVVETNAQAADTLPAVSASSPGDSTVTTSSESSNDFVVHALGGLSGDPHLNTFDGLTVTYLDCGDFVLAKGAQSGLMYQGRFCRRGGNEGSSTCSLGLRCDTGADVVEIHSDKKSVSVAVNGADINVEHAGIHTAQGIKVARHNRDVTLTCASGFEVTAFLRESSSEFYIDAKVKLPKALKGATAGLLGVWDGHTENDIADRSGDVWNAGHGLEYVSSLEHPSIDKVQTSWRVAADEAIFTKHCSDNECLVDLDRRTLLQAHTQGAESEVAAKACAASGLTGVALKMCIFDFIATKDESFVQNAVRWSKNFKPAHPK